jgi:hypothetical protein
MWVSHSITRPQRESGALAGDVVATGNRIGDSLNQNFRILDVLEAFSISNSGSGISSAG